MAGAFAYVADDTAGLAIVTGCDGLLFADDFEAGDTSAWAAASP